MNLQKIMDRKALPTPFLDTGKLPWDQPEFSARALREHLDDSSDSGSRSEEMIREHVRFMMSTLSLRPRSRVLDMGCGPGLYCREMGRNGIITTGIDISPSAIDYAERLGIPYARFILGDIRDIPLPRNQDAAVMTYGEFNMFSEDDARRILSRVNLSLKAGGYLLLEVSTKELADPSGCPSQGWWSYPGGDIWSDEPYLALKEAIYLRDSHTEVTRYYIIHQGSGDVEEYSETRKVYRKERILRMLSDHGFKETTVYSSMTGGEYTGENLFAVFVSRKESREC